MKVLVIGSGGREHALTWKVAQSPLVTELYAAPGNPGMAQVAELVDIKATDIDRLLAFALEKQIDLTVVGPEQPLAMGIVDRFEEYGLKAFGPNGQAAQIEASKVFFKDLMQKYHIPTATYQTFDNYDGAITYIERQSFPLVIKADGLAAGKGVVIAQSYDEARETLHSIMQENIFGIAGAQVVIEEFLIGDEISLLAFVDGTTILPMVTAQDHKQAYDGDKGPNTGGMGTYSPATLLAGETYHQTVKEILEPTVAALRSEGINYKGVLYAGLMLTANGPKLLEYNCRFGDPEAQVILPRLETDLVEVMLACIDGKLAELQLEWYDNAAVCVILASGGYPVKYDKGFEISGLDDITEDIIVFHAGTATKDGKIVTNGGRVFGITAVGDSLESAIISAYNAVDKINFTGKQFRTDIAQRKK